MLTFEGQCSWKGGRQWSGRSVRQANGRTVYALHVPAFGDGNVDDLRSRRIYIGDQTDSEKVSKRPLEDVDCASWGTRRIRASRKEMQFEPYQSESPILNQRSLPAAWVRGWG